MNITFVHGADLHLDSPFQGLDEARAARRRAEQRELLLRLTELVRASGAQLLLLSGDLLDSALAYRETAALLESCLSACPARVFLAPGNHDWYGPGSPYARLRLPENVHIFTSAAPEAVELPELGLRVWGCAFHGPESGPLLRGFSVPRQPGTREIMVLHGELNPRSAYDPIAPEDIAGSGLTYLALGHNHSASGLRREGRTYYAWPGCPEGRGFDECGEKGVYLGTLDDAGACTLEFRPLARRHYHRETLDLTAGADPAAALCALLDTGAPEDIWRVYLKGERDAAPDLAALERAGAERCFALELRDRTRPRRELWAQAGEDSLRGLFLGRLRRAYESETDEAVRQRIVQAVRWGLQALEGGEELP